MTRRVLKWIVPADDDEHVIGAGPVVLADSQGLRDFIVIWTEEDADDGRVGTTSTRTVLVFGTGHRIPDGWSHLGSAVCGPFVWHAYSKDTP